MPKAKRAYPARPFRIWDEREKMHLPHRCYSTSIKAVEAAVLLVYWLQIGNAYTVYNSETGKVIRQFAKRFGSDGKEVIQVLE